HLAYDNYISLGQVRWCSAFMDLTILLKRYKLCREHEFSLKPSAVQCENHLPGCEPRAIPSSTEWCEASLRPLLPSCGRASIVTPVDQPLRVSHAIRVWNSAFDSGGDGIYGTGESSRNRHHSFGV